MYLPVIVLGVALAFLALFSANEYVDGVAIVRFERKTDITTNVPAIVATVAVWPGQRVTSGATLVRLSPEAPQAELRAKTREWEVQIDGALRDITDLAALDRLAAIDAERRLAKARIDQHVVRAPRSGVIRDLAVRSGSRVQPGDRVCSIIEDGAVPYVVAFMPASIRRALRPGMQLRLHLNGQRNEHRLTIVSVDEESIGRSEERRDLEPSDGSDVPVQQEAVVRVRARFDDPIGSSELFDGARGHAIVSLERRSLLVTLARSLKGQIVNAW